MDVYIAFPASAYSCVLSKGVNMFGTVWDVVVPA